MRRPQGVEPSLGWSYLSRDALARAKAQMDEEFTGVRDEIGFLTINQSYADRFFPGASVLHTRARYTLIVPCLFEDLAGLSGPAASRTSRSRVRTCRAGKPSRAAKRAVCFVPSAHRHITLTLFDPQCEVFRRPWDCGYRPISGIAISLDEVVALDWRLAAFGLRLVCEGMMERLIV